ncbi:hypothetical protein PSA7680_03340 [Pseudoruegeria aquimaris]|uniref:Beta-barrel assembly machine subunit BamF n=1 Tax=Pseudoruegeria aquimaris TaxID=393663 RepID=A0A1Y5TGN7_9RHOB|nr:DUF3035 domain-containing protein [Pseudoruegeria aquimaris]SLN63331.1 hypothetical protein PSA7680_03340 [Pseudoruegeria aquimaris]
MSRSPRSIAAAFAALTLLSACGGSDYGLMNIRSEDGTPDEFGILPTKPLETPESFASLPTPTPGGTNLVDPTPKSDAVAALGGNPSALAEGRGIASSDGGMVRYASRYGVTPDIRSVLAQEDAEFRKGKGPLLFERWVGKSVYFEAYRSQALDQTAELQRFRRAGVKTPSAPPELAQD